MYNPFAPAMPYQQMMYDYLHEQHIEHAGEVKAKQMLYKGQ